jgi:HlyD family secretion protein
MVDIQRSPSVLRRKKIKRVIYGVAALVGIVVITVAVSRLKPAAPTVDRATVWVDTVKRGSMVRQVRGSGTLVPEITRWIPASTQGQVERIVLRPGAVVKADSVILELSNPTLEQAVLEARLNLEGAQAQYENQRATLESQVLNQQSTVAQTEAAYRQAQLQREADEQLAKDGLVSEIQLKRSRSQAEELKSRVDIEQRRLKILENGVASQLGPARAEVDRRKTLYTLQLRLQDDLRVRAGIDGVLQQVPVEVGAQVSPGTNLARVADPTVLKAEIRIAETQARDIQIGQKAAVDTRNGIIEGRVARIDPAAQQGTVGVDVTFDVDYRDYPRGARPDLNVDGTIELERLEDVVYVGRPAFGQEHSTVGLFKLTENGEAVRVNVKLGRSSVQTIEVEEGLQPGDQVILSDMSAWDAFDRVRLG